MTLSKKQLLYFGPLTIAIEWTGIILLSKINGFNLNEALSTVTTAPRPSPLIFGVTLTLASITYFIFSLSLKTVSSRVPHIALLSGIAFTLTGWIPYRGDGGTLDVLHSLCSYIAVVGYMYMIWTVRNHPVKPISKASMGIIWLLLLVILISFYSLFIAHRYIALIELLILFIIQAWTIIVVWHSRELISKG